MPNQSRFSKLPHRIILPVQPVRRHSHRALHLVSFAIAAILVAFAMVISHYMKGN